MSAKKPGSGGPPPFSLKLEFSRAADYDRVNALFDPAVKNTIDPSHYILKRQEESFRATIADGGAVMLTDPQGDVMSMTLAYHFHEQAAPPAGAPHDHTELGTSMARMPGYNSAQLIVAVLALKEWWACPPQGAIVTAIDGSNIASVKTYKRALGWEMVKDPALSRALYAACYANLADEHLREDRRTPAVYDSHDEDWYRVSDRTLATLARVLLSFMDQGGLLNKQTGRRVAVDFSALDDAGLTRARLEALAAGETSRARLQQITPGPAP